MLKIIGPRSQPPIMEARPLTVTYVTKEGPFLLVWGQTERHTALYVEQVLQGAAPQFNGGAGLPHPDFFQVGILCCAQFKDNKYYRARITNLTFLHNRYIEVFFIDSGNKDLVAVDRIRSLEGFDDAFLSIPPQAAPFLLAEAANAEAEWNDMKLDEINKDLRGHEVRYNLVTQVAHHFLARVYVGSEQHDLAILLINRGIMRVTGLATQEAVLLSMMPRLHMPGSMSEPTQVAPQQSIAAYKAYTLEPGRQYEVYVSYVTEGPSNFSVQLKQSEEALGMLMKDVNSMVLCPLDAVPIPGTVCLARCIEDGHICRAVVTNEVDGLFKVFYVDFGNFESLPIDALYDIPFKYVIPKAMAIRYSISGVEKSAVTLDMQCAFKQFVDNRLMHMRVLPMTSRTALPKCELWDPTTGVTAIDVLNQASALSYPSQIALGRGFTQPIKVSYVFSCSRFFVQLKCKEDELNALMADIQIICQDSEMINPEALKPGLPCYALFEGDSQFYRSQIVEISGDGFIKVQYVDYGNEELVTAEALRPIEGRQLRVLKPQAIHCCLNGYQNMEADIQRDGLLEELIFEQEFTMKVVEMIDGKALIELIDANNFNVASKLLEKIANARLQASPILVQADNKIIHKKREPQPQVQQTYEKHNKFDREQKQWEHTNGNNWRQGNNRGTQRINKREERKLDGADLVLQSVLSKVFKNRNNYEETNEGNNDNASSWRQTNKGFNNTHDNIAKETNENDNDWRQNRRSSNENHDRNKNEFDAKSNDDGGDSWRQDKGFEKNRSDRPRRDNNRDFGNREQNHTGEWGSGGNDKRRESNRDYGNKEQKTDEWGSSGNDTRRDNRNKEEWGGGGGREKERNNDNKREQRRDRDNADWGGEKKSDSWNNRDGRQNERRDRDDKKDDWGGGGGDERRKPFKSDDWQNDRSERRRYNEEDGGERRKFSPRERDNREDGFERKKFSPRDRDNFKEGKDRQNTEDNWKSDSRSQGGFHKKSDNYNKRDYSENGSEKSFQRGGFKGQRHDGGFNKGSFDRAGSSFSNQGDADPWNTGGSKLSSEVPDAAPSTAQYNLLALDPSEASVTITWFHNPEHFYCQIKDKQADFKSMMEDIQEAYKSRLHSTAEVGAPCVGLFPADNVLYRARVLEKVGSRYKVQYVDFGNTSVIDKVWPIETRLMEMPAQALYCSLSCVAPPGDAWPNTDDYALYFNKDAYDCKFLNITDGWASVQLSYNNQDIGDQLVQSGLASHQVLGEPRTVEISFLCNQQFRAMLLSANSLADFVISLQSGEPLLCSVFNLENATEQFEDALKEKLGQILIVYVDNIIDERLQVTLYDGTGTKIKLIDADEEAFETVEILCCHPVFYSTVTGYITHADESTVFLQPSEGTANIEYLLEELFNSYNETTLETPLVPEEEFVYGVLGTDGNWYRGKVISFNDEKVTVNYVDYGNSEEVDFPALRELTAEFMEMHIQCIPVIMDIPTDELVDNTVTVSLTSDEAGWKGALVEQDQAVIIEQAIQAEELLPAEVPQEVPFPESRPDAAQIDPLDQSQGTFVILSHTDSPNDFYLQLAESLSFIDELQANLQGQVADMPDLDNPTVGVLCAAPYSVDQQWYRAHVLDVDTDESDITTVRFVDFGNTDVLENGVTKVKTLPPHLLSLEVYATRCRLRIKPIEEEWSTAATERFQQLVDTDQLVAKFVDQDEKVNYVELTANGQNVAEVLIGEGLAVTDVVLVESKSIGFVSHLNSPSEFWIQLESCIDELEWIAEQLSSAEEFAELDDMAPGTLCAALFPDDQQWYRARILSNTVAGQEVLFIDYGNSCTSCSLKELREDLVMLPPLAQKCSLQKPAGLQKWSPDMAKKFSEIAAEGQTMFTVRKLSTGETASVELLLEGADVAAMLLPFVTEGVTVKSCDSLDQLVLVQNGEEMAQKYSLEPLTDVEWNEESIGKFAEINEQGKTIFRAEFVADDTVRLFVEWNDVRLDLPGTKKRTSAASSPLKSRSDALKYSVDSQSTVESLIDEMIARVCPEEETTSDDDVTEIVSDLINRVIPPDEEEEEEEWQEAEEGTEAALNPKYGVLATITGDVDTIVSGQEETLQIEESECNIAGNVSDIVDSVVPDQEETSQIEESECVITDIVDRSVKTCADDTRSESSHFIEESTIIEETPPRSHEEKSPVRTESSESGSVFFSSSEQNEPNVSNDAPVSTEELETSAAASPLNSSSESTQADKIDSSADSSCNEHLVSETVSDPSSVTLPKKSNIEELNVASSPTKVQIPHAESSTEEDKVTLEGCDIIKDENSAASDKDSSVSSDKS